MKIYAANQIREWDAYTIRNQQMSSAELMERAAKAAFECIQSHPRLQHKKAYIFCGSGNNGGDGLVIGRLLHEVGAEVQIIVATPEIPTSRDFELNFEKIQALNIPVVVFSPEDFPALDYAQAYIIDAIFGIGLNKPLSPSAELCIQIINEAPCHVVSIDLPTGIYLDKVTQNAVKSDWVLTFQTPKLPLLLPQFAEFAKKFSIIDISLDESFYAQHAIGTYVTQELAEQLYKPLQKYAHKGTQGHVCLIGGSYGKMGAVILAAKAALKSGCGLVTVYVPQSGVNILQTSCPEVMTLNDSQNDYLSFINLPFIPSSVGIGVGMGVLGDTVQAFTDYLKTLKSPAVFDADAINILAQNQHLIRLLPKHSVLTPHPKELQRLVGTWSDDFVKLEKVKSFALEYQLIVILKGAHSVITDGHQVYFNSTGNPGMATAGLGDTLTGVVSSLLAQNYKPLEAAILATYIHGKAADLAVTEMGKESFSATDMWHYLGKVFKELNALEF